MKKILKSFNLHIIHVTKNPNEGSPRCRAGGILFVNEYGFPKHIPEGHVKPFDKENGDEGE